MKRVLLLISYTIGMFCMLTTANAQSSKTYPGDAPIEEQINFVINESSKWQNYKMILETWTTRVRTNTFDTLNAKKAEISGLNTLIEERDLEISSLSDTLGTTRQQLEIAISEKDTFLIFGASLSKSFFLSIVIFVILSLLIVAVFAFFLFQRGNMQMRTIRNELDVMREEFEMYRQQSRQKYENMVIQHHKEIQKLKG
jgi:hypothetical protein